MAAFPFQLSALDAGATKDHAPHLLQQHLQRLKDLPAHGNRLLHYDQVFLGQLLAFFDPLCRSLRKIEACGSFAGRLDLERCCRSTMSDALAVFDPRHLTPIVQDLLRRVPKLRCDDPDLVNISQRIIAADGTYLTVCSDVVWALVHTKSNGVRQGQVRANVQLDVATFTPQVISISGADGESEGTALAKDLLSGVLYVVDRNFLDFAFLTALLEKKNDFVLRLRKGGPALRIVSQRQLSPADVEAGVTSDQEVVLTGRNAPTGVFRLVVIQSTNRDGETETLSLLTSLTSKEIAGHVIGAIYRQRWQIELFFKWFKTWARMDHLFSASRQGITFQFYVTMIAVLLMYVQSGHRISSHALHVLSRVAYGQMSMKAALEVIKRRERERQMDRARRARKRACKKVG